MPPRAGVARAVDGRAPADAVGVVTSVAVIAGAAGGFLTASPCGAPVPATSNINYAPGSVVANAVVSALGRGQLMGEVAMVLGSVVTLTLVVVRGWALTLSARLNRHNMVLARVEEGRLDVAAPVSVRDELGLLAARTNQMIAGLAERERLRQVLSNLIDNAIKYGRIEGQVAVRTRGTYEEKKETRGKIKRKPWYIIDPRTSKFMGYWDAISMVSYAPVIETASQQPELASCARHCGSAHEGLPSSGSPHAASTDSANGWLATAPALHARAPSVSPVWLLHACRRLLSCSRPSSPLSR
jgi:hypothetical protein